MVTDMFEKCNSSVNLKSSNSSILETSKKIVFWASTGSPHLPGLRRWGGAAFTSALMAGCQAMLPH